jgi:hypothetical protein
MEATVWARRLEMRCAQVPDTGLREGRYHPGFASTVIYLEPESIVNQDGRLFCRNANFLVMGLIDK